MLIALALLAASSTTGLAAIFADLDRRDAPGCVVDVRRGGAILARHAYGMADLETNTPNALDTVFEAGSVSKQFTAAGVAVLAASGRLSLDDSVRRWIPELPPLHQAVTLRMLLNHTSGVRNWNNFAELSGLPEGTRVYDQAWALRAIGRQTALNNEPGAEYLYSNSNYVLASIVVERASGRHLQDFYRDTFFGPLGMGHTRWRTDHLEVVPGRAQAYLPGEAGAWRLEMPFNDVVGPGGLLTTVGDMQRWNDNLRDPRPADRAWVALMTVPGRLADGTRTQYALGLELDDVLGARAVSHAGATASYRAWLGQFPDSGLSVALLCNAGNLDTQDLGPKVAAVYLPAPATPPRAAPATPAPSTGVVPVGIDGLYRNVASDAVVAVTVEGDAVRFGGGAPFRYRADGTLANAGGTRTARVDRRPDGAVSAIVTSRPGNAPVTLMPTSAWLPDAAGLTAFEGSFRAAEVDGEQRFAVDGSTLVWLDPMAGRQVLKPTYPDAFEAPDSGWTLRFERGPQGRVSAVYMSIGRARRIRFDRSPAR